MEATRPAHIGTRIKYWRRHRGGMTQEVLAGLAGVSRPFVSMVEGGRKTIERRHTLVAFANALEVSVADLLGQPGDPTDPRKAAAAAAVPAIRAAVIEIDEGERRAPTRGPEEMAASLDQIRELTVQARYAEMAGLLPGMLLDAAAYGGVTLARVAYSATSCLRNMGWRDLALTVSRIAATAAGETEDPAWIGATGFLRTVTMPIESAPVARRTADRLLAELQPKAKDVRVRQVLGLLHLSTSFSAATDGRPDDAAANLRAAAQEAATLGDPPDGLGFNLSAFGPTNVGLWRMAVAAENGEWAKVIELASKVRPGPIRTSSRHQTYWLDYGRALAHSGKRDPEARAAFLTAEQAAPALFTANPLVHDTILTMYNRAQRNAIPDDLRVLAMRVGIDVSSRRR
jgi:transcriptional regulator with XRE-family HTH domain